MSDLTDLSIAGARDGLTRKDFTARELTQAYVAAAAAARPLNAFLVETPERALAAAKASDERIAKGLSLIHI